jgi:hypothetical protein
MLARRANQLAKNSGVGSVEPFAKPIIFIAATAHLAIACEPVHTVRRAATYDGLARRVEPFAKTHHRTFSTRTGATQSGLEAMSRLIRAVVARKSLLLIIGLWLAAGTTAGYFLGAAENNKGLDAVTVNNTDIRRSGENVFLVYTCNNQEFERYDIDRAHLIDGQDNLYGPTESLFQKTYSRAFETLGGGGLTHVLTYAKPIARSLGLSKRERMRYFVAGVTVPQRPYISFVPSTASESSLRRKSFGAPISLPQTTREN